MKKIIDAFKKWQKEHDEDYQYDEIFEFVNKHIDRGDMLAILEWVSSDLYSELRGLLKENAQFPEQWDTDARLREWLEERDEL